MSSAPTPQLERDPRCLDYSMLSEDDQRVLMKLPCPNVWSVFSLKKSVLKGFVLGNPAFHDGGVTARTKKRELVDMVMMLLHPINNPRFYAIYMEGPRIRRENRESRKTLVPPVCAGPSCTCHVSLSALTFNRSIQLSTKDQELLKKMLKVNKFAIEKELAQRGVLRDRTVPFCRIRSLVLLRNTLEDKEADRREGRRRAGLPEEEDADRYATQCVICCSGPRQVSNQPCGHTVSCAKCSHRLGDRCCICRAPIKSKVSVKLV